MPNATPPVRPAVLAALRRIDTATISTAVNRFLPRPEDSYTDLRLKLMIPELGSFIGYAATVEVTTNDLDSPALSFYDYYKHMEAMKVPVVAVFKDVDSIPGRGASFGEGMSVLHRKCGAVAVVVDGTIRDIEGLRSRKFPAMAWGAVPGHGRFKPTRFDSPVTVCGMRIRPGDLLQGDINGLVRIPTEHAEEVLRISRELMAREKKLFPMFARLPLDEIKKHMSWETPKEPGMRKQS